MSQDRPNSDSGDGRLPSPDQLAAQVWADESLIAVSDAFELTIKAQAIRETIVPVDVGWVALGFWMAGPFGVTNPAVWRYANNYFKERRVGRLEKRAERLLNGDF